MVTAHVSILGHPDVLGPGHPQHARGSTARSTSSRCPASSPASSTAAWSTRTASGLRRGSWPGGPGSSTCARSSSIVATITLATVDSTTTLHDTPTWSQVGGLFDGHVADPAAAARAELHGRAVDVRGVPAVGHPGGGPAPTRPVVGRGGRSRSACTSAPTPRRLHLRGLVRLVRPGRLAAAVHRRAARRVVVGVRAAGDPGRSGAAPSSSPRPFVDPGLPGRRRARCATRSTTPSAGCSRSSAAAGWPSCSPRP